MDTQMVLIAKSQVEQLLVQLQRAEGYCLKARPASIPMSREDLFAEPTEFYSGASGYARSTMRQVIDTLESHLQDV
jgi:hypothetical protein